MSIGFFCILALCKNKTLLSIAKNQPYLVVLMTFYRTDSK